ncbi:hypothetical protein Athai_35500 [Actinocatenispora thailandica]|uniref:Uncharacterized protein n=1 Tax=Actinocatenispora thailandica TaxID=227318 RepID=A0A7R7DR77_9ACTN|nr:hypothetical protein [Actinocatenispora thailandica]BCJ36047.1 hypothetical protein Athai_35500 [Actinocatenispora thailandica]
MSQLADTRPLAGTGSPRERYRRAVAALAAPLHDQVAGHDRTDQALVTGRREIADRLGESAGRVHAARSDVAAAADQVEAVDRRARRIWRELAALPGRPRDLGPTPIPRAVTAQPALPATELLDRAERTVTAARLGELPLRPPVPIWAAMVLAGAVGALVCAGIGTALLVAAPGMPVGERAAARVIADVAFALGVVAGVPGALSWLSRYGQPMTARAFGAVFGTGAIATIGLFVLLGH